MSNIPFWFKRNMENISADNQNNIHDVAPVKEATDREYEIEMLIREKYSMSQEIAILRKIHLGKITEDEFKAYSDYVEECIKKVPEDE